MSVSDTNIMQIIEAMRQAQALDPRGQLVYVLEPQRRYVMFDNEAFAGVRDGALKPVAPLDELIPAYQGQPLTTQRLLVLFTGGQGDAVLLKTCLNALCSQYPESHIDICCPRVTHDVLSLLGGPCRVLHYPLAASELSNYSYYMSLENLQNFASEAETGQHAGCVTNLELFGRCLYTPAVREVDRLELDPGLVAQWDIGQSNSRVGIALTKSSFMRAYPSDLSLKLAEELIARRVAVLVFGRSHELDRDIPHCPPWLFNAVDKVPSLAALAALISQLDAMVTPDSLFMHLAGALRVPTLAIFTSSPATVAGGYPTVQTATAAVDCSPCGAAGDDCPLKHNQCIVHRHAELAPAVLAERALRLVQPAGRHPVLTG